MTVSARFFLFLALGSTVLQCTPRTPDAQSRKQRESMTPIPHPNLSDFHIEEVPLRPWYEAIEAADDFMVLKDFPESLTHPRDVSLSQCDGFLGPEFDPHRLPPGTVEWAIHVAEPGGVDLLRARYEVNGLQFRLLTNVNFTRVDIRPRRDSLYDKDPSALLSYITGTIVHSSSPKFHEWVFELPKTVILPLRIANIGAVEVREIMSRRDRLDIMLSKEAAYIQLYAKIHQYLHYQPTDTWFSPEARRQFSVGPTH